MRRLAWLAFGATLLLALGAQAQTLERVRATGTFKIGFREDAEPFSFKDAQGEAAGFSIELCRLIATQVRQTLGLDELTIEYVPVGTEDRFQAVKDGRIDILCSSDTVTLSRRELVKKAVGHVAPRRGIAEDADVMAARRLLAGHVAHMPEQAPDGRAKDVEDTQRTVLSLRRHGG